MDPDRGRARAARQGTHLELGRPSGHIRKAGDFRCTRTPPNPLLPSVGGTMPTESMLCEFRDTYSRKSLGDTISL